MEIGGSKSYDIMIDSVAVMSSNIKHITYGMNHFTKTVHTEFVYLLNKRKLALRRRGKVFLELEDSKIFRQSVQKSGNVFSPKHRPPLFPGDA